MLKRKRFEFNDSNKNKQACQDALEDLLEIAADYDKLRRDVCEWFDSYGSASMIGSQRRFKHRTGEDLDDIGNLIWTIAEEVIEERFGRGELPLMFRLEYSADEEPSNEGTLQKVFDEVLDKAMEDLDVTGR